MRKLDTGALAGLVIILISATLFISFVLDQFGFGVHWKKVGFTLFLLTTIAVLLFRDDSKRYK